MRQAQVRSGDPTGFTDNHVFVRPTAGAPDDSWYHGPPYAVAESVLDENDLQGCSLAADAVTAPPVALEGLNAAALDLSRLYIQAYTR